MFFLAPSCSLCSMMRALAGLMAGAARVSSELRPPSPHHGGGAHVLLGAVLLALLDDARVGELDGGDGAVLVVAALAIALERPGRFLVLAGEVEELAHFAGGDGARHLAGGVPAHAVEDREDVLLGEDEEVVLVIVALHPDIGLCSVMNLHVRGLGRARSAGCFRLPRRASMGQTVNRSSSPSTVPVPVSVPAGNSTTIAAEG